MKTIYYDVHFKVKNPKLSSETISVMLHVDLEVQNDYSPRNPRYPIVKRAVYGFAMIIFRWIYKIRLLDMFSEKEIVHMTGLGESLYNKAYKKAYNEAYNEACSKTQKNTVMKMVRKNYLRNGDQESAIIDLQEELELTYEQAEQLFRNEIQNAE